MSDLPPPSDQAGLPPWATQLHQLARALPYPPTPDLTRRTAPTRYPVTKPWISWAALGLAVVLMVLAVSPASAGLWEWLQIGVVRILRVSATATPIPTAHLTPTFGPPLSATPTLTPTLLPPGATPLPAFADWPGLTTLAQAKAQTPFHILRPTYPADLGEPDYVFAYQNHGAMVVLVWLDPQKADEVLLSFQILEGAFWIEKALDKDSVIVHTEVAGAEAVWTNGPYPIRLKNGDYENTRLVKGHVLIWAKDNFTYRLETSFTLTETLSIAESLR